MRERRLLHIWTCAESLLVMLKELRTTLTLLYQSYGYSVKGHYFARGFLLETLHVAMQITMEELNVIDKLPHYCPVCAYHEWNLDGLVEMIWDYIDVLRIYTKPKVRDYHVL